MCLCSIGLIFSLLLFFTEFKVCFSESLKDLHCYVLLKSTSLKRGDIVSIRGHREDYVGEMVKLPYTKRILGVSGDKILRSKDGIWVESQAMKPEKTKPLTLLKKDRYGNRLTPISATIIPEGYVFVVGDNPKSFDSRYEEFGLVPNEKIWGRAILWW